MTDAVALMWTGNKNILGRSMDINSFLVTALVFCEGDGAFVLRGLCNGYRRN